MFFGSLNGGEIALLSRLFTQSFCLTAKVLSEKLRSVLILNCCSPVHPSVDSITRSVRIFKKNTIPTNDIKLITRFIHKHVGWFYLCTVVVRMSTTGPVELFYSSNTQKKFLLATSPLPPPHEIPPKVR